MTTTPSTAALTATIDLGAIAHNVGVLRASSGTDVIAVVKADAYGHGAVEVARAALGAGAAELGVAHITEALALRRAGIDAHITSWLHAPSADFAGAVAAGIDIAVSSPRQLDAVVAAARSSGVTATVTVKVDTGLNRSGVAVDEWDSMAVALAKARAEESITMRAAMTHLVRGDEPDHPLNSRQADRLDAAAADLARLGTAPQVVHLANSPAALVRPDLARDLVRPGIALYGRSPLPDRGDFGLIPAMTLTGEISLVKRVTKGQGVSYSHTWTAPHDTVVAVIPAGYADGIPRTMSGRFEVLVNGRRFPAIGRVCMDQFVIDLGPEGGGVAEGDLAELFGRGDRGGVTAADWADATGTIDYEILSAVRGRTARRYVGGSGEQPHG
ncbi:alanine racemase [Gordonia pseudamarae]|jgi:alanine racemase|uniref:Alanine racemase n=1 Tax=Gordonia pseudamarae TaxID=2831662 RepID=A0ABX6IFQ1_9ACTN|nr:MULTISPECIES: alanine racemase [Gordonia]MBD0020437.1 alanine racemase [Gordonia sp. (in: high G+C Gram-positive bacteria)]QHN25711.1 alanine racemase [Gordonia pseudamarae]QHN34643.1 alanine racemase [Gordonia pseudamarae]